MASGIVLAGGRSMPMGLPTGWRERRGATLLHRTCAIVARGAGGPVVVVCAPGQALPALPAGVRVVEDARDGEGPLPALLAGLEAADGELAFVAAADLPCLHPRFVAAVCAAAGDADAAVPVLGGEARPLAAAYRTALVPLLEALVADGSRAPAALLDRCDVRRLEDLPHPESVRPSAAAGAAPPSVRVRALAPDSPPPAELQAATVGAAAAAVGVALGAHMLAALNGDRVTRDPLEPLAEGDEVTFMAADAAG